MIHKIRREKTSIAYCNSYFGLKVCYNTSFKAFFKGNQHPYDEHKEEQMEAESSV